MTLSRSRVAVGIVWAVVLGAGIGSAVAATTPTRYNAVAKVLVSAKGGTSVVEPFLPNLRQLATSSVVAGDVTTTLHIHGSSESFRKRIHASTPPHTQVVELSLSDRHADRARQITQEVAVVFAGLVHARFGRGAPVLKATVLDPAHVVSRSGPDYFGNALIGAAIGLAVGLLTAAALRRPLRATAVSDAALRRRERQLERRVATVTARETALARRAGEIAVRERALREAAAAPPPEPIPEPEPVPQPEPEPVLEAEPEPLRAPPERVAVPPLGWTLDALERLVEANAERFPARTDEWNAYLFYLRDYADAQGRIPRAFDGLIQDAFADFLG